MCPYCNLELKIDQQQSQGSLSKLKNFYGKYQEAEKMYEEKNLVKNSKKKSLCHK